MSFPKGGTPHSSHNTSTGPRSLPRGVPTSSLVGVGTPGPPHQEWMGYPHQDLMGVTPIETGWGYPPPSPDRAAERVLAPQRAVCLFRLHRRTFLFSKLRAAQANFRQFPTNNPISVPWQLNIFRSWSTLVMQVVKLCEKKPF